MQFVIKVVSLSLMITFLIGCAQTITESNNEETVSPVLTYNVIYHGNGNTGGDVPIDANEYSSGNDVKVKESDGVINIDGITTAYCFKCWNTMEDGSGIDYLTGDNFKMPENDIHLYVQWRPFEVRDTGPAGGIVYDIKADYSGGFRYMEVSRTDLSDDADWDTSGTLCNDYELGGYSDWYLPALDDWGKINVELSDWFLSDPIGDFKDEDYWSSGEGSFNTDAYSFNPVSAFPSRPESKTNKHYVRAIRKF